MQDFNPKSLDTFGAVTEKAHEVMVKVRNMTHLLLETKTYKDVKWISDVKRADNNKYKLSYWSFFKSEKILPVDVLPIERWYRVLSFISVTHLDILIIGSMCRDLFEICRKHPKTADVTKYGPHVINFKLWAG